MSLVVNNFARLSASPYSSFSAYATLPPTAQASHIGWLQTATFLFFEAAKQASDACLASVIRKVREKSCNNSIDHYSCGTLRRQLGSLPIRRWCATQAQHLPWRGQSLGQGQSMASGLCSHTGLMIGLSFMILIGF